MPPPLSPYPARRPARGLVLFVALVGAWIPALGAAAAEAPTGVPRALRRLIERLPGPGRVIPMAHLGISAGPAPGDVKPLGEGFDFRFPADLDRRSTTAPPFKGRYPALYLNQPLRRVDRDVHYLFLSDQPEEIRDDRLREDGSRGVVGTYARATVPAAAPTRVLVDHTNGTKRPLRYVLAWIPRSDGMLMVRRRGARAHPEPTLAAREAFVHAHRVGFEPNIPVSRGAAHPVVDVTMPPGDTFVAQLEFTSTVPGELCSVVLEPRDLVPASTADVDRLPVLHSIVWREEARRLEKFVNPERQPTRFKRILGAYQHARGLFPQPDRQATLVYDARGWDEGAVPVRAFSFFESIPGLDATVPAAPHTDNRGRYGAVTRAVFELRRLPPGCREMAVLLLNPYAPFGGRNHVTDTTTRCAETSLLPRGEPGLLPAGGACLLWRGAVKAGGRLVLSMESLANTSVYPWYLVIPIPPEARPASPAGSTPR